MKKKTAIIILNYNTYQMTLELVHNLDEKFGNEADIIVVDNASPNESAQILKKESEEKGFIFLESKENGGYAKGNNIGIRYAQKNGYLYVLISNNDVLIQSSETLRKLEDVMKHNPKIGAVSPKLVERDGRKSPPIYYRVPSFWDLTFGMLAYRKKRYQQDDTKSYQVYAPRGSFMLLRNSILKKAGNFDESTFLYYEEPILAERIRKVGGICWHCGETEIVHLGSETIDYSINKKFKLDSLCQSYEHYLRSYRNLGKIRIRLCILFRRSAAFRH